MYLHCCIGWTFVVGGNMYICIYKGGETDNRNIILHVSLLLFLLLRDICLLLFVIVTRVERQHLALCSQTCLFFLEHLLVPQRLLVSVLCQVNLEHFGVVLEPQRMQRYQYILSIYRFALICGTPVSSLTCNER